MKEIDIQDLLEFRIWENDQSVIQIEPRGSEYKVIMFSVTENGLDFVEVAFYKDPQKIIRLIEILKLTPTHKNLVLKGC